MAASPMLFGGWLGGDAGFDFDAQGVDAASDLAEDTCESLFEVEEGLAGVAVGALSALGGYTLGLVDEAVGLSLGILDDLLCFLHGALVQLVGLFVGGAKDLGLIDLADVLLAGCGHDLVGLFGGLFADAASLKLGMVEDALLLLEDFLGLEDVGGDGLAQLLGYGREAVGVDHDLFPHTRHATRGTRDFFQFFDDPDDIYDTPPSLSPDVTRLR